MHGGLSSAHPSLPSDMLFQCIVLVVVTPIFDFQRVEGARAVVADCLGPRPELILLLWWYPPTYEHVVGILQKSSHVSVGNWEDSYSTLRVRCNVMVISERERGCGDR